MNKNEQELQIIGQGTYGCVFRPNIECSKKDRTDPDFLSKIQQKDRTMINEINIGKKLPKSPRFAGILKTCPVTVGKIGKDGVSKCKMIQNKQSVNLVSNKIQYVINLQGDLPQINQECLVAVANILLDGAVDIGTLACEMTDPEEINSHSIVKAIADIDSSLQTGQAINFTRNAEASINGNHLHHIGLYAYTRVALEKFVQLPQSVREKEEKLEQLRALDNQMRVDIKLIDFLPLGVDTPEDLEKMQKLI